MFYNKKINTIRKLKKGLKGTATVTIPRHNGGHSPTNKITKHKQTRENTQQLNLSLQVFITTIRLKQHTLNKIPLILTQ